MILWTGKCHLIGFIFAIYMSLEKFIGDNNNLYFFQQKKLRILPCTASEIGSVAIHHFSPFHYAFGLAFLWSCQ